MKSHNGGKRRRREAAVQEDVAFDDLSHAEHICALLCDIQWKTNCSTLTLQSVLDSLRGKLGDAVRKCKISGTQLPRSVKYADKKMRETVCLLCQKVLFIYIKIICIIINTKIID